MTTHQDIRDWMEQGVSEQALYLIVVCDTFSYEDYPVYAASASELSEARSKYGSGANMQRIMGVYDLKTGKEIK